MLAPSAWSWFRPCSKRTASLITRAAPPICWRNENTDGRNASLAWFVIRHSSFVILIMSVLILGSIALDTVKTPIEERSDLLGGSASYAAAAASFFSPVKLVGIVGSDFPQSEFDFWRGRKIDIEGVQR